VSLKKNKPHGGVLVSTGERLFNCACRRFVCVSTKNKINAESNSGTYAYTPQYCAVAA